MNINHGVPAMPPPPEIETSSRPASRLYLFEPGWRISIKRGSEREFCYQMAPGQDYYHRLLDGEIYLHHHDEKLCLACAVRRGLIAFEPRRLRNPIDPSLADFSDLPVFDPDSGDLF
jgi:hypothetical protein